MNSLFLILLILLITFIITININKNIETFSCGNLLTKHKKNIFLWNNHKILKKFRSYKQYLKYYKFIKKNYQKKCLKCKLLTLSQFKKQTSKNAMDKNWSGENKTPKIYNIEFFQNSVNVTDLKTKQYSLNNNDTKLFTYFITGFLLHKNINPSYYNLDKQLSIKANCQNPLQHYFYNPTYFLRNINRNIIIQDIDSIQDPKFNTIINKEISKIDCKEQIDSFKIKNHTNYPMISNIKQNVISMEMFLFLKQNILYFIKNKYKSSSIDKKLFEIQDNWIKNNINSDKKSNYVLHKALKYHIENNFPEQFNFTTNLKCLDKRQKENLYKIYKSMPDIKIILKNYIMSDSQLYLREMEKVRNISCKEMNNFFNKNTMLEKGIFVNL